MTLEEVASFLRVSEKTVKDWVMKGELPGGKLGTSWRFRRDDIEHWVEAQLSPNKAVKGARGYSMQALLKRDTILITDVPTKNELLNLLIDKAVETVKGIPSRAILADAVFSREDLMSTGIGLSVGIPHVRINGVKEVSLFVAINKKELEDYESLDNIPVRIVFFIVAGPTHQREHLQTLASVSRLVKRDLIREQLLEAKTADDIYEILISAEKEHE